MWALYHGGAPRRQSRDRLEEFGALLHPIRAFVVVTTLLAIAPLAALAQSPAAVPAAAQGAPPPPTLPPFPENGAGLCQCQDAVGKTAKAGAAPERHALGLRCLATVEECKSACGSAQYYRYVPHAGFSCPLPPGEPVGPVAISRLPRAWLARLAAR